MFGHGPNRPLFPVIRNYAGEARAKMSLELFHACYAVLRNHHFHSQTELVTRDFVPNHTPQAPACMPQPHPISAGDHLQPHSLPPYNHTSPDRQDTASEAFSSPVYISHPSSRHSSRVPSPLAPLAHDTALLDSSAGHWSSNEDQHLPVEDNITTARDSTTLEAGAWGYDDDDDDVGTSPRSSLSSTTHRFDMPSDLRPNNTHRTTSSSHAPLLNSARKTGEDFYNAPVRPGAGAPRKSTFQERDPEVVEDVRKRYTYAAGFLALSLVSFVVQTETAVYIQHNLKWNKAYCML